MLQAKLQCYGHQVPEQLWKACVGCLIAGKHCWKNVWAFLWISLPASSFPSLFRFSLLLWLRLYSPLLSRLSLLSFYFQPLSIAVYVRLCKAPAGFLWLLSLEGTSFLSVVSLWNSHFTNFIPNTSACLDVTFPPSDTIHHLL